MLQGQGASRTGCFKDRVLQGQGASAARCSGARRSQQLALSAAAGDPAVFEAAVAVLGQIRQRKSEAKVSIRVPVDRVTVTGPVDQLPKLEPTLNDVLYAGAIQRAELRASDTGELTVDFEVPGA